MEQQALDFDPKAEPEPPRRPAPSFHVRSHMRVDEVLEGEARAAGQEEKVLRFFQDHAQARFTPSEVHARLTATMPEARRWPLTSVRRAITNLTLKRKLARYRADRRPGVYGKLESTWALAPEEVPRG